MQFIYFIWDEDCRLCITWIIHQQLSGYKVEEKLYLGVREQEMLNTTELDHIYALALLPNVAAFYY
jgi:hypothetical protein